MRLSRTSIIIVAILGLAFLTAGALAFLKVARALRADSGSKTFNPNEFTLSQIQRKGGTALKGDLKTLLTALEQSKLTNTKDDKRVEASIKLRELFGKGEIDPTTIQKELSSILGIWKRLNEQLRSSARGEKSAWRHSESYQYSLYDANTLADMLGKLGDAQSLHSLQGTLNHPDILLRCHGVMSLISRGSNVPVDAITSVVATAETRGMFYHFLEELKRLDLFPAKYKTQRDLAESDMVNWLTFPSELDTVPDRIELVKVVSLEDNGAKLDYYVYRFRTDPPHWAAKDGWMFGVAGPYSHNGPIKASAEHTFSQFDSWKKLTPEQIVDEVRKLK